MARENANSTCRRLILTWERSTKENSGTFDDPTDQKCNVLLQSGIDPEGVIASIEA